ncbi:hypothetical protein Aple_024850 [Acrocarpospora pleiomorpha]|uniref:Integrase catalytic domain-containing protein n=1 Tax=Acrocarpospora pleiomorpha TaxID=90975 RepID=A0A5M3XHB4_9ACTN|nr:integrase core domain-containing protein [Acrocarpospora pleiomorpha]GES19589.1 hypothetical protein Aple_024850 [Acrocarpospora pleiomorpha]
MWTAQQARNILIELGERAGRFNCLIRDRDGKFSEVFDQVLADGVRIIKTPPGRRGRIVMRMFARMLRRECLDHVLIYGERHLRCVLAEFERHYNDHRPHQSRDQMPPLGESGRMIDMTALIRRRKAVGA